MNPDWNITWPKDKAKQIGFCKRHAVRLKKMAHGAKSAHMKGLLRQAAAAFQNYANKLSRE